MEGQLISLLDEAVVCRAVRPDAAVRPSVVSDGRTVGST